MNNVLSSSIAVRLIVYYGVLALVSLVAWGLLPPAMISVLENLHAAWITIVPSVGSVGEIFSGDGTGPAVLLGGALLATVASVTAFILALPVAWVYIHTRQKKGYTQSVMHSLILLPVLVAAVVVLVKNSLALAFALAGIVAAVRFRNTLKDSRDTVYVFMVIVLGLAAGAQPGVAIAISVLFNIVVLSLWHTDFGRTPPGLEEDRARRRLKAAMALANRTSQFVARLDAEVLEAMAPAQLDALADRVRRRRRVEQGGSGGGEPSREGTLRVTMARSADARSTVEAAFAPLVKRWSVHRVERGDETNEVVVFWVRLRKSSAPADLVSAVEQLGSAGVLQAVFEERTASTLGARDR